MHIGLGPYSKQHYFQYYKRHDLFPKVLVELDSKREDVSNFIQSENLQMEVCYLSEDAKDKEYLTDERKEILAEHIKKNNINKAVIATEPKAHKSYTLFFIEQGIDIFVEKPLTAICMASYDIKSAEKIYTDYLEIVEKRRLSPRPEMKIDLHCHRRYHPVYQFLKKFIVDFSLEYRTPMTFCSIYHSDGMWNMPNEFLERENHPYKYGYGKLLHSGYHFIDLFVQLINFSFSNCGIVPDRAKLFTTPYSAKDFLVSFTEEHYNKLFNKECHFEDVYSLVEDNKLNEFGELDCFNLLQLKKGSSNLCTGSFNLLQTGFSERSWLELPKNTYKGNGRIRHEQINIQFGHLLNIQVHSYKSGSTAPNFNINSYDVGGKNHFDVFIFRNSKLVGGESFEKVDASHFLESDEMTMNEISRDRSFNEFLHEEQSSTDVCSHELSIFLLYKMLYNICKDKISESNTCDFDLPEKFFKPDYLGKKAREHEFATN